ncbi:MAG: YfiM family protein [Bacteroidales bacterium]|nr:YfiM family protein [Bacteroidales bacterium]MCF8399179.1 YfiM family protein [Bacteroidales bacterium]
MQTSPKTHIKILLLYFCFHFSFSLHAQERSNDMLSGSFNITKPAREAFGMPVLKDDTTEGINKKRLRAVVITEAALFSASMFGLYHLWYKDYPQSTFHFINDNHEWMQMDKIGHGVTSYYIGKIGYETLRWSNVPEKKAVWYGGTLGFVYLLTIETLDGFSKEWGASTGDLIANIGGSGIFIGQQLLWKEQRMTLKFSFHPSEYAQYRPDLLGKNFGQNIIKDYNGQTYWLSANLKSFSKQSSWLPDWLNVAVGYSAEGMTGALENSTEYNDLKIPAFPRYRQFFFSLDADLTKIKTNSEFLKILFQAIGFIKIPFPALEINTNNETKFHWLYF